MILSNTLCIGPESIQIHTGFQLINFRKVALSFLCCLLMTWQPVLADDPDLQATVKMMQDLSLIHI